MDRQRDEQTEGGTDRGRNRQREEQIEGGTDRGREGGEVVDTHTPLMIKLHKEFSTLYKCSSHACTSDSPSSEC